MNTETKMMHVTINYLDVFGNETSKSGSVDSLEALNFEITNFIGVDRVISIEFKK